MIAFPKAMDRLLAGSALDAALVGEAFESILAGEWTPIQVGAFASAVRVRGETAEAIAAATRALRAHMTVVEHGLPLVADTCGTGGDGAMTLNVSTAAAIVVAACNVSVAKHGNRSISSNCGSADVIEALGVPIDLAPEKQADLLRDVNIAFLFAPAHHPALKHAAAARRELGVRTIFNALGPVANPARATHQVVGVYDDALRPMLARVLADLGSVRAWVVRSTDGLDEISPATETRVSEVNGGDVTERTIAPEDFGLARASLEGIRGGSAAENAKSIETILSDAEHAAANAVLLTAAAMLHVCGVAKSLRDGTEAARAAITSGAATRTLEDLARGVASDDDSEMSGVLEQIVAKKRAEVEAMRGEVIPSPSRAPFDVLAALRRAGELALVAEVKRKSPSAGVLSTVLAPRERAEAYARAGAAMVSVLCDELFFDGSYDHVAEARAVMVPLLAKEFVIDPLQVVKARAVGADAVLVIVRILAGDALRTIVEACRAHELEPFVEVTNEDELARALDVGARVIGVNARDLDTLAMDAARTQRVIDRIPRECVAVHLSGLRTPEDVAAIASTRADAALVGESLMREDDPTDLLKRMLAHARK